MVSLSESILKNKNNQQVKRNYYYLVAGLQDITLDIHKLSMGQVELREELENGLHPKDYEMTEILFYPYDNSNLLNLLNKNEKEFDSRGNFDQSLMEENIKVPTGDLPVYMEEFIISYKSNEQLMPEMSLENQLTTLFYQFAVNLEDEFLSDWFRFNRDLNNLLTALKCRKYDIPYENQIIGDDDVSEAVRKSHARDFGLSAEIPWIEDLLNIIKIEDVKERERSIDQLRWNYLEENTFFEYFTISKIQAFILKLDMVERWLAIDAEHGRKMFKELLEELKSSYNLPETFTEK